MNWKPTYRVIAALLFLASGAALSYGAYLIYPPLCFFALAGFLYLLSTAYMDAGKKEKP